jgi:hypothetical protein
MLSFIRVFFLTPAGGIAAESISGILTAISPPKAAFLMKLRLLLVFSMLF